MDFAPALCGNWCHRLFCQKRHEWVQQPHRRIKNREKIFNAPVARTRSAFCQFRLHPLDIPVAEVSPEKLVNALSRPREIGNSPVLHSPVPQLPRDEQTSTRPPMERYPRQAYGACARTSGAASSSNFVPLSSKLVQVHEQEPRCIPDFVRKVPRSFECGPRSRSHRLPTP